MRKAAWALLLAVGVAVLVLAVGALVRVAWGRECRCACVNGYVQQICPEGISVWTVCAPRACVVPGVMVPALPPLEIPPIGMTGCSVVPVWDALLGDYVLKRVCR